MAKKKVNRRARSKQSTRWDPARSISPEDRHVQGFLAPLTIRNARGRGISSADIAEALRAEMARVEAEGPRERAEYARVVTFEPLLEFVAKVEPDDEFRELWAAEKDFGLPTAEAKAWWLGEGMHRRTGPDEPRGCLRPRRARRAAAAARR